MKIDKTNLPFNSVLANSNNKIDFSDSFRGLLNDTENRFTPKRVAKAFFTSGPRWVEQLFAIRNHIVALFGLKTSGPSTNRKKQIENFTCQPNEQLGLFKVFHASQNEVILGEDDKHLNFRVSLFLTQDPTLPHKKVLTISTTVQFNHWLGRCYFLPVRPFHKLIVPTILKGIIKELEQSNTKADSSAQHV